MDVNEIKNIPLSVKEKRASTRNIILVILALVLMTVFGNIYLNRSELPQVWEKVSLAAVSISSLFFPNEHLDVSVSSSTVESGKVFSVTYNHIGKRGGGEEIYDIQYRCSDGLFFKLITNDGNQAPLFCDTPADIGNLGTTTINLLPILSKNDSATTTILITYNRTGVNGKTMTKSADIEVVKPLTLKNGAPPANPSSANEAGGAVSRTAGEETSQLFKIGDYSTTTTTTYQNQPSNPNGYVDLAVRILGIGTVDKNTGQFTATSTLKSSDRIAIRFDVMNVGTKTSKEWSFSASLPTYPWYIFQSGAEPPLSPGDKIRFTLGFDNIEKTNGNLVVLNADPNNQISDNLRSNNTASTTINNVKF